MNPPSPCIGSCRLDNEDICTGCKRTIDEVVHWRTYTDAQKAEVFKRLQQLASNQRSTNK